MTISPGQLSILPTRTQQFTASGPATWTVDGIASGNAQVGTISSSGLYTAPGTGVFPLIVTVGAQSPGNPQNKAEAPVTVVPVPVVRAARVSAFVVGGPNQAAPLRADRVSAAVSPAPTQALPLLATRVAVERQPVITESRPPSGSASTRIRMATGW
jgi:hypothetical protein